MTKTEVEDGEKVALDISNQLTQLITRLHGVLHEVCISFSF
jgi:hypothetical protein